MSNFARPAADALEPGDINKHLDGIKSGVLNSLGAAFAVAIGGITNRLARVIDRTLNGFRGYDID
jgi:hypothetical protein